MTGRAMQRKEDQFPRFKGSRSKDGQLENDVESE